MPSIASKAVNPKKLTLAQFLIQRFKIRIDSVAELSRLCEIEHSLTWRIVHGQREMSLQSFKKVFAGLERLGIKPDKIGEAISEYLKLK